MTTLVLENPSIETLEDGRIKYIDSFGNLLKLKAIYGDKFEIEPLDGSGLNTLTSYLGKTRSDNGQLAVIPGHEAYAVWPFHKLVFEDDQGKFRYFGKDIFYCIIPEGFRNTMKPGRYVKGVWENAIPCLANFIKNIDTDDTYVLQHMGGSGDPEYRFADDLIDMFQNTIDCFMEVAVGEHLNDFEQMLPLCIKRIGYLKPE